MSAVDWTLLGVGYLMLNVGLVLGWGLATVFHAGKDADVEALLSSEQAGDLSAPQARR